MKNNRLILLLGVCQDVGIPLFLGISGHTNTVQTEKTYGDYLKEFKKSKAEQAAEGLNNI